MTDNPQNKQAPVTQAQKDARYITRMSSVAFDVPFTFFGAVVVGGFIGYFLDKWLHTGPWLMIVFGCLGFAGGIIEIIRRFGPGSSGKNDNNS